MYVHVCTGIYVTFIGLLYVCVLLCASGPPSYNTRARRWGTPTRARWRYRRSSGRETVARSRHLWAPCKRHSFQECLSKCIVGMYPRPWVCMLLACLLFIYFFNMYKYICIWKGSFWALYVWSKYYINVVSSLLLTLTTHTPSTHHTNNVCRLACTKVIVSHWSKHVFRFTWVIQ